MIPCNEGNACGAGWRCNPGSSGALAVLGHEDQTVGLAALKALGEIGTQKALPALFDLESDARLGEAATASLRQIQARERIGGAGRLSLAAPAPQAGAVSLAESAGALELATDRKDEA